MRSQTSASNGDSERDRGRRLRRGLQQPDLVAEDEAPARHAVDLDGHELAARDELLAERVAPRMAGREPRVGLRGADPAEDVAGAGDAEQAVGAVAREELVPHLLAQRRLRGEQLLGEQPLDQVVVAAVAVAAGEAEDAGDGIRLEHGPDGVGRRPEPVGRRALLALEVERAERPVGAHPVEHAPGHLRVVGEGLPGASAQRGAEPRVLAREDEREPLVGGLEDLAALVEQLAPGRVVVGDAGVQDEVVAAPGDGDRVELDRPEPAEHLEHRVGPALERPRRGEAGGG